MNASAIRLDHVALAVPRLADVTAFVAGELGGTPAEGGPGPGYTGLQWRLGEARLEILEPAGAPGGFLHRFVERRGPGFHHVTFIVPDHAQALARAAELGYQIVGLDDTKPWWKEAFLHPKQAHGIVVQLAEENPGLSSGAGWSSEFPFPPSPPPASPAARLVGVRMSFRRQADADRQWVELLGAKLERHGSLSVYRWPASPLRIAVEIDGEREEGPLFLEVTGPRELPREPDPRLGVRFVNLDEAG